MPPFIPQTRRLSPSASDKVTPNSSKRRNIFDTADKATTSTNLEDNKAFLESLNATDDESSLSDVSSVEFEDVFVHAPPKKRKTAHHQEEEEEIEWEDAIDRDEGRAITAAPSPIGDLEITLDKDVQIGSLTNPHDKKKGPSKIERQIRMVTHCMHVQFLLFHNLIRNGWICNKEIQSILVNQLPPGVKSEVKKWRIASGLNPEPSVQQATPAHRRGRKDKKAAQNERNQRDWGRPAERQERGAPNMSRGDPVLRLLKVLAAYWKKRFTITAPSLRKQGYKSLSKLEEEIASWRDAKHDAREHGERIKGIEGFRKQAKLCEGSRDVGAQLFTALVRGLGLDARMVASLQPVGFGWNKMEEAVARNKNNDAQGIPNGKSSNGTSSEEQDEGAAGKPALKPKSKRKNPSLNKRGRRGGGKEAPIDLSSDSGSSDKGPAPEPSDVDDDSIIDVTPVTPRRRPNANYDRDMVAPTYWTEIISPLTNEVHPVDPLVITPAVVTNPEHLTLFESRGARADKAKQVFAYVIAYSMDGTAKEVTTRYLKRHIWPGRTKGVRMPIEKVPVYNHRGKIKRYEEYDWFKTVLSGYERAHAKRTAVDDLEEAKDLKVVKPERKEAKVGEETLQGYKSSAEYVLRRHLRREEALRPEAKPVKTFVVGKGDKALEEPVYLRKDVEICRTGESWHKEGRAVKAGEHPMKKVPVRAVTMNRKREVEEAERDGGEKLMQGMYARDQTDWIIPPPIENGIIPKNAFGNMDCYVPTMIPKGAAHIPLRSTVKICKRLGIDYAEAVTGFEFGKRMAVPIITGVVIAEENEDAVMDEWEKDEMERKIKEEGKREKQALATWRKWLMGLRIIQRVKEEYGNDAEAHLKEEMNPFTNKSKAKKELKADAQSHASSRQEEPEHVVDETSAGGFMVDDGDDLGGGGFFPGEYDKEEGPYGPGDLDMELATPAPNGQQKPGPRASDSDIESPDRYQEKRKQEAKTTPKKASNAKPPGKRGRKRKTQSANDQAEPDMQDAPSGDAKEPVRKAPRRQSARKRATAIKSQYFEHGSDEDLKMTGSSEASDGDDEEIYEPPVKHKKRGRPSKGKARGID